MSLTCKILENTIAKQSTAPSSRITDEFKASLPKGEYAITKWEQSDGNHFKVTFEKPLVSLGGRSFQTWLVWGDVIRILKDGKPDLSKDILIDVPYYSQLDNAIDPFVTCNSSSHAMLLNSIKPGSVKTDDEYFKRFVGSAQASTDWGVHTRALKHFGIESEFRTDLSYEDVEDQFRRGFVTVIGVLHKGVIGRGVFGGHCLVACGIDGDSWICNDPFGEGFSYINRNGKHVLYPKYPTLDARWLCGHKNGGWGRIIKFVDGKKV